MATDISEFKVPKNKFLAFYIDGRANTNINLYQVKVLKVSDILARIDNYKIIRGLAEGDESSFIKYCKIDNDLYIYNSDVEKVRKAALNKTPNMLEKFKNYLKDNGFIWDNVARSYWLIGERLSPKNTIEYVTDNLGKSVDKMNTIHTLEVVINLATNDIAIFFDSHNSSIKFKNIDTNIILFSNINDRDLRLPLTRKDFNISSDKKSLSDILSYIDNLKQISENNCEKIKEAVKRDIFPRLETYNDRKEERYNYFKSKNLNVHKWEDGGIYSFWKKIPFENVTVKTESSRENLCIRYNIIMHYQLNLICNANVILCTHVRLNPYHSNYIKINGTSEKLKLIIPDINDLAYSKNFENYKEAYEWCETTANRIKEIIEAVGTTEYFDDEEPEENNLSNINSMKDAFSELNKDEE